MDIEIIRAFFLWCTIIGAAILLFSFLVIAFAGDWVYSMQSKWHPISRETFYAVNYSFIGIMKILVIMLFAVPLLALLIIG